MSDRKPPSLPWNKASKDYDTFDIKVSICEQDREGCREVFSQHNFATPEDQVVARKLKSLGEEQISYALLVEALRREVYVQMLVELGKNSPEFLVEYLVADETKKRVIEEQWGERLYTAVCSNISKMAIPTAKEVLEMLSKP